MDIKINILPYNSHLPLSLLILSFFAGSVRSAGTKLAVWGMREAPVHLTPMCAYVCVCSRACVRVCVCAAGCR